MLDKTLEDRRSEFTTQLSKALKNFVNAQNGHDQNLINEGKTKVDAYILDKDAGKLLDIESKEIQENLKNIFFTFQMTKDAI